MGFNVACSPGKDAAAAFMRVTPQLPALVIYLDPVNIAIQLPPFPGGDAAAGASSVGSCRGRRPSSRPRSIRTASEAGPRHLFATSPPRGRRVSCGDQAEGADAGHARRGEGAVAATSGRGWTRNRWCGWRSTDVAPRSTARSHRWISPTDTRPRRYAGQEIRQAREIEKG